MQPLFYFNFRVVNYSVCDDYCEGWTFGAQTFNRTQIALPDTNRTRLILTPGLLKTPAMMFAGGPTGPLGTINIPSQYIDPHTHALANPLFIFRDTEVGNLCQCEWWVEATEWIGGGAGVAFGCFTE